MQYNKKELEKIELLQKKLKITREEAEEIMAYDKAIDKGEKTEYDLTPEQQKAAKKYTITGQKAVNNSGEKQTRERKKNEEKENIISMLHNFLLGFENIQNAQITNAERQISFVINDNSYELTLVQKRKKKT